MDINLTYNEGVYDFDGKTWTRSSFESRWIPKMLGYSPKVIFEFGSYDGGDAVRFKKDFPDAKVYSFEPDPYFFDNAKSIEKYGVNIYNAAICDRIGTIDFYRTKNKTNNSYLEAGSILKVRESRKLATPHVEYENSPIKVPCTTINQFCFENNITEIDFMQVDVEGAADKVIRGFDRVRPKILFVELQATERSHEESATTENVKQTLYFLGYDFITTNQVDSLFLRRN